MLNPGNIPINDINSLSVYVALQNSSTNGSLSTKSFAVEMLTAAHHPFFPADDLSRISIQSTSRQSEHDLRRAGENALRYGNKHFLFIDEAQHLLHAFGRNAVISILDSWKVMAQKTRTVLILGGTHELGELLLNSAHIIGRSASVEFPRYFKTDDSYKGFMEVLVTFDEVLQCEKKFESLSSQHEFLYTYSHGCVGILHRWIRKALANAYANNDVLCFTNFDRTKLSERSLAQVRSEANLGETVENVVEKNKQNAPLRGQHTDEGEASKKNIKKSFKAIGSRRKAGNRTRPDDVI
ncbi:MAG: hypothetical protein EOO53_01800 [Gammaproteobacteria bacterium]|nr:MAG: hypothetical protein EOO53_01800 [Gammaproteobacteria bacterium]